LVAASVQAQTAQPSDRDPAIGGSPDIPLTPARSNAALQYHLSWRMIETLLERTNLTAEEIEAVDRGELPERYREQLAAERKRIEGLIEVTKLSLCDFGNHSEKGIDAILPHLGVMRETGRLLIADAKRLEATDMDAAVDRIAATIRLGEHAAQTNYVIGSLVGVAIAQKARVEIQRLLDAGLLTADQAGVLDGALDRVLTEDPFHSLCALETEAAMMEHWILFTHQGDDAGEQLSQVFIIEGIDNEVSREERRLRKMNGEQLAKQVEKMVAGYEDTIGAWNAEEPVDEMQKIEQKNVKGEYGVAAKLLLPALASFRNKVLEAEQDFKDLREQLQEVSKG